MLKILTVVAGLALIVATSQNSSAQDLVRPEAQEVVRGEARPLPLSVSSSSTAEMPRQLTIAQQRARFAADQRMLRAEWNNWIGHSPLRPTMNGSHMSNGPARFYIPSRGVIVSAVGARAWYW